MQEPSHTAPALTPPATGGEWLYDRPRAVLVVVLSALVALIAWSVGGEGRKQTGVGPQLGPMGVSATELRRAVAITLKQPVYWAGPRRGYVYELTRSSNGSVLVRYLPLGVKVGDPRSSFLTVATYPDPNAFLRLQTIATGAQLPGGMVLPGGGFVLPDIAYPDHVHIAFAGVGYAVEIYGLPPNVVQRIAGSGGIRQVR